MPEALKGAASAPLQSGATAEKASGKGTSEASEKKVKILEHQRNEVRGRAGQGGGCRQDRDQTWAHTASEGRGTWLGLTLHLSPASFWR